ncbi:hypothetical protein L211DRAFT_839071 [Terfezia boudieri ATCC MYA-4762]|uniref:Uncharacterized protein n=1 Tax=Terfezia boudieri ATCC MYA-4762 TaxID=1051890 RepID=A0A3N4LJN0_9PEZI|nr:hypothetical protein L211DRAFT_839071 [Terfezia boudieri ATCC MYA-4762]
MQLLTVTLTSLTLSLLTTLTLADPTYPSCHTTVYTCKGNFKCCTMPLQPGGVAAYCAQGNMTEEGCSGTLHTICCRYDAEEALTPRGYTYVGCSEPGKA